MSYSHSKLGTFEQCRMKYKLHYIDKVKVESETTVECFMGDMVHRVLEKLYKDLKCAHLNSKEELLEYFDSLWSSEWTDDIIINNYSEENYKEMGKKYISDYYDKYHPFDQLVTIGLETTFFLELDDGSKYHVKIDRLACDGKGNYYVCDYKTNKSLKLQSELDNDRQLAMYGLWVKKNFPDCKSVSLVWYFLAFGAKEMISKRTDEELVALQEDVVGKISEIENCTDYPTNPGTLCNWCGYKDMCPAFMHKAEIEALPDYTEDDGVKMVNEYAKVSAELKKLSDRKDELKDQLIAFAKQKDIDVVYGSEKKASVKAFEKVVYPEDKEKLISMLKNKGIYDDIVMISYPKLNSLILKKQIDADVIKMVSMETGYRISLAKRKGE